MSKSNNTLNQKLEELEQGKPLEEVLKSLPKNEPEMASLIRLVDQVHSLPHPELDLGEAAIQHQQVMAEYTRAQKTDSLIGKIKPASKGSFFWESVQRWLSMPGLRAGLAVSLVGLIVIFSLLFYNYGPVSAHGVTLKDVTGMVEVSNSQDPSSSYFATSGQQIFQGQTIKTYADSSVTLAFFNGSQTTIDAGSTVTLTSVKGDWHQELQVQLTQSAGITMHNVVPMTGNSGSFQVLTPSGKASVHGTIFEVNVSSDGNSIFAVDQGNVQVSADGGVVYLTPGEATLVTPDTAPQSATFQFKLFGLLASISGNQWTASGVTFMVGNQTNMVGSPQVGDFITVVGRTLTNSRWVADLVEITQSGDGFAQFTGLVDALSAGSWKVSGRTVTIDLNTEISPGIKLGDPVQVSFGVQPDGTWLATAITSKISQYSPIEKTEPINATNTPSEEGTETEVTTPTTGSAGNTAALPSNSNNGIYCTNLSLEQPEGKILAEKYQVGYSEIMGWYCKGYGFGEIDLVYSLSAKYLSGVANAGDIFLMRETGQSWGQITQSLKATQVSKLNDHNNSNKAIPIQPTKTSPSQKP